MSASLAFLLIAVSGVFQCASRMERKMPASSTISS